MMTPMRRRWGPVVGPGAGAAVLVAVIGLVGCADSEDIADQQFRPAVEGRLTVATSLPAPGFWDGQLDELHGGFEWGIARALADRYDLTLEIVDVPFERLLDGDLGGADLALAQITITDERADHLAFSDSYYIDDAGVVLPSGEELTDLKSAQETTFAVQRDTVESDLLDDTVRPDDDPILFDDAVSAIEAVADGRAEAALVDLSTALVATNDRRDITTGARFATRGEMAVAMPVDSDNVEVVDAALRAFASDRTLEDLERDYLEPVFQTEPDLVPTIRTADD